MENKKDLMLPQHSALSTEINNVGNHASIIVGLKNKVSDVMSSPSIFQLTHAGANRKELEQVVAVLISKYANMLTVGGNMKPEHAMEYAKNVLNDWPTMSFDDLNILLANGVKGRYNEKGIMRFDIAVLYDSISKYQDEWSAECERILKKRKSNQINLVASNPEAEKLMNSFLEKLSDFKSAPKLTEEQIKDLGTERQRKKSTTVVREKFIIEGMEVSADSEVEARKIYDEFKRTKK
jgi:hypothetical protein